MCHDDGAPRRGTAPACAFVSLGFDLRALPTNTPEEAGFAAPALQRLIESLG
jgi:hypothetical protein